MLNHEEIAKLKKEIKSSRMSDGARESKQRELGLLLEEALVAELGSIATQLQAIAKYLSKPDS